MSDIIYLDMCQLAYECLIDTHVAVLAYNSVGTHEGYWELCHTRLSNLAYNGCGPALGHGVESAFASLNTAKGLRGVRD